MPKISIIKADIGSRMGLKLPLKLTSPVAAAPSRVKRVIKPMMKKTIGPTREDDLVLSVRAVTNAIYPGSRGNVQGEVIESIPARSDNPLKIKM